MSHISLRQLAHEREELFVANGFTGAVKIAVVSAWSEPHVGVGKPTVLSRCKEGYTATAESEPRAAAILSLDATASLKHLRSS